MIKAYIIPQLNAIKIDNEISLRLTSIPPTEPDGGAGLHGEDHGGGETGWSRADYHSDDIYGSDIWY